MQMQKQPGVIEVAQYRPPKGGGQGYQARNGPSRRKATASAIPSLKSFESEHPIFKAYNEPCTRALSGPKPPGKYLTRSISGPSTFDNPPTSLRCLTGKIVEPGTESQRRIIRIGIEAEFEIASFVPEYSMDHLRLGEFVKTIARNYNKQVPEWHPRMREGIRSGNADDTYHEWCLVLDPTVRASQDSFLGLELVSPILRAMPGSRWREDVEAVWQYLLANYRILADPLGCSTHVHISLEPFYSISELKRIAQAVIHFEPAFEVFVGSSRRANLFAKSNWLDSSTVAKKDRTRSQLIADIERGASEREIVRLMQERGDRNYSWNFWSLFSSKRTIEFRKPPAGTTSKEVIAWAELAISFIQASVGCRSPQQLQKVPATVGGLRWFISQFTEPGVNDLGRLQILWGSEDPNAALPPVPCRPKRLYTWQVEEREKELERLKRLAAADQRRNQAYAKIAREPYW